MNTWWEKRIDLKKRLSSMREDKKKSKIGLMLKRPSSITPRIKETKGKKTKRCKLKLRKMLFWMSNSKKRNLKSKRLRMPSRKKKERQRWWKNSRHSLRMLLGSNSRPSRNKKRKNLKSDEQKQRRKDNKPYSLENKPWWLKRYHMIQMRINTKQNHLTSDLRPRQWITLFQHDHLF